MRNSSHGLGAALLAGLLILAGGPAVALDDIDSDCPAFEGRTHAQILHGVEGRLKGDWNLAIKTTERSARRIKEKGEDPTRALQFVEVLKCLQAEVRAGEHADAVAQAKADPRGGAEAGSSGQSSSSGQNVVIGPAPAPAAPAPAPAPAPQAAAQPEPAKTETKPVEKAEPPPAPIVQGPTGATGEGVALPGTAESYGGGGTTESAGQAEQQAALPLNATEDYSGKACVYFTRPLEETVDGVRHINRYLEGEWVCYQSAMYACIGGVWQAKGACEKFSRWETRSTDLLEAEPRS